MTAGVRCALTTAARVVAVGGLVAVAGCGSAEVGDEAPLSETQEWVDHYEPERAWAGYTLVLRSRNIPTLIDMDGTVVHSWESVKGRTRARLLPDGSLMTFGGDTRALRRYSWDGELVWEFEPEERLVLHHDFWPLENGNFMLIGLDPEVSADVLLEVSGAGEVVWRWDMGETIPDDVRRSEHGNTIHTNSVYELGPNPWFDAGHEEFRPGNILFSARNISTLFIVDRQTGDVTWRYDHELDYQHEAFMIPRGWPGEGNIVYFNNGMHNLTHYRSSAVIEVQPVTREILWEYRRPEFFSEYAGAAHPLPNGNLFVTSSRGGRVFEVTRDGDIVWQWAPDYYPTRASRYAPDFAPQLAALGAPASEPIRRRDPSQYVDASLYQFGGYQERRDLTLSDERYVLSRLRDECRVLSIPDQARLTLGYGATAVGDAGRNATGTVRFEATLSKVGTERVERVLRETVKGNRLEMVPLLHPRLRMQMVEIELDRYWGEHVELCLSITPVREARGNTSGFVWLEPQVKVRERTDETEVPEALRETLRAHGYVG